MSFALRARGISKSFGGVKALTDVDLDVVPGEVLCLAGANGSGKSTLIKIISGVETPDSGTIEIDGEEIVTSSVAAAVQRGVQVIFQDMSLFPNLTVAENIAMSERVKDGVKVISGKRARSLAKSVIERLGIDLDLEARVENISVADRQLVAICRALALDVKVLFMDEPTTALTWHEIESLRQVVEQLKKEQVGIVFVSHKTEEVFAMSDRIVVLRNGVVVRTGATADFTENSLVEALVGYLPEDQRRVEISDTGEEPPALSVEGIGVESLFADVSFAVGRGEIVGLTGLLGSGRSEIAEAIFGKLPIDTGTIAVGGETKTIRSVADAITAGIGYVPEDRLTQGVVLGQSIERNLVSAALGKVSSSAGVLKERLLAETSRASVAELQIKTDNAALPVSSLSGGNQQRVVLGKWMLTDPKVLILNGPTVGVDAGSKATILEILRDAARSGMGVLLISDDVPELVSVCHRVLFVRRGRLAGELAHDEVAEPAIRERLVR
ncbi:sugar ABC transporter ATP-binding protein [Demequina sp. NBRC 110052]|uniref:sugar ABC transporter ATP-binding protein n=1 Tax=Demequina sp. NBRC 110052 TaxID=1570341 RepID=UPI0009FEF53E|nr:sugar ABC transporter ATP-binding protein [Demequina sp. NBRC 110052]